MTSLHIFAVLGCLLIDHAFAVMELTDQTFYEYAKDKDVLLVDFYAPWCGDCKALDPDFESAANSLGTRSLDLAKVDCFGAGKALCETYGVKRWPTLKNFNRGTYTGDYNGGLTANEISGYITTVENSITPSTDPYAMVVPPPIAQACVARCKVAKITNKQPCYTKCKTTKSFGTHNGNKKVVGMKLVPPQPLINEKSCAKCRIPQPSGKSTCSDRMVDACDAMTSFSSPTQLTFFPSNYVHSLFKNYTSDYSLHKKSLIPIRGYVSKRTGLLRLAPYATNDRVNKLPLHHRSRSPCNGVKKSKTRVHRKNVIQTILTGQSDHQSYLSINDALNLVKDAQTKKIEYPFMSSIRSAQNDDLPKNALVYTLSPPTVFQENTNEYHDTQIFDKAENLTEDTVSKSLNSTGSNMTEEHVSSENDTLTQVAPQLKEIQKLDSPTQTNVSNASSVMSDNSTRNISKSELVSQLKANLSEIIEPYMERATNSSSHMKHTSSQVGHLSSPSVNTSKVENITQFSSDEDVGNKTEKIEPNNETLENVSSTVTNATSDLHNITSLPDYTSKQTYVYPFGINESPKIVPEPNKIPNASPDSNNTTSAPSSITTKVQLTPSSVNESIKIGSDSTKLTNSSSSESHHLPSPIRNTSKQIHSSPLRVNQSTGMESNTTNTTNTIPTIQLSSAPANMSKLTHSHESLTNQSSKIGSNTTKLKNASSEFNNLTSTPTRLSKQNKSSPLTNTEPLKTGPVSTNRTDSTLGLHRLSKTQTNMSTQARLPPPLIKASPKIRPDSNKLTNTLPALHHLSSPVGHISKQWSPSFLKKYSSLHLPSARGRISKIKHLSPLLPDKHQKTRKYYKKQSKTTHVLPQFRSRLPILHHSSSKLNKQIRNSNHKNVTTAKKFKIKNSKPYERVHETINHYVKLDRMTPAEALRVPYDPKD